MEHVVPRGMRVRRELAYVIKGGICHQVQIRVKDGVGLTNEPFL